MTTNKELEDELSNLKRKRFVECRMCGNSPTIVNIRMLQAELKGRKDKEKELIKEHNYNLALINRQDSEDLEFQRKELFEKFEKIIDKTYLKKECNCDWFLKEIKQQLQELKSKGEK